MIRITFYLTFLFGSFTLFNSFIQVDNTPTGKKILVVINSKTQKLWTKTEYQDSILWSAVKSVYILPDTAAVRKYGKKGTNGALIIQYNQKVSPLKPTIK